MVNFMLIVVWPTVSSPALGIFAQDYNQVHDATVVNANGQFRSGNPLPSDRRRRYCRRRSPPRPRVPEPHAAVLVGRAGAAGAARAAARFPEIWLPSRKRQRCRRRAAADLFDHARSRPARDPMQSVQLVCRARLPCLRDAPGVAGARRQGRHLYERLRGAAHLADHRGARFFALLRRRLRRSADAERPVRRQRRARLRRRREPDSGASMPPSRTSSSVMPSTAASACGARPPDTPTRSFSGPAWSSAPSRARS